MPDVRHLTRYPEEKLDRALEMLSRAGDGRTLDPHVVEDELLEILYAAGLAHDGSAERLLWEEFVAEDPDPKALRDHFGALSKAEDPLAEAERHPARYPGLRPRLRGCLKRSPPHADVSTERSSVDWSEPSDEEQERIRALCRRLETWYASLVCRRGGQRRSGADTALELLADLFLSLIGKQITQYEVAYTPNSYFIGFAVAALEPVAMTFDVTPKALSERYRRIVRDDRREAELLARVPDSSPEDKGT